MADFSMSDMPWLTQTADPVGSLARGVQAGSMIAENRNQSAALAQRRMQFEQTMAMEQQKLASELAQVPLRMTLQQQEAQMNAIKIQDVLEQRQFAIEDEKTVATAWDWTSQKLKQKDPMGALSTWMDFAGQLPRLTQNPKFLQLRKDIGTALEIETERQKIQAHTRPAPNLGGVSIITDPLTGKQKSYVQTGSGSLSEMWDGEAFTPRAVTITDPNTGKPITLIQTGKDSFREPRGEGEVIEFTSPTGEKTSITRGGGTKAQGDLTTVNQTRVQQGLAGALQTIDTANRLEPLIDNETVGVQAFAESWIKDRILAQRFPGLASNKRANAETLVAELRASAVQELKTDSNITEAERGQILQAVPEINSPIDSPVRAKELVSATRRMAAIRAVVAAGKLKQPMPKAAAQQITPSELKRLVDTGVITKEQALEVFDAR
jgi:hypothetical protein